MPPLPAPEWFDEIAVAAWVRVCKILVDRGTLQDVNHATLEGYCSAYSKAVRADKVLNEKGFVAVEPIFSRQGVEIGTEEKKRPEVDISLKSWNQVKMFAVELGITISTEKPPDDENLTEAEKALREADRIIKNV